MDVDLETELLTGFNFWRWEIDVKGLSLLRGVLPNRSAFMSLQYLTE
jgi:hypothetical protein